MNPKSRPTKLSITLRANLEEGDGSVTEANREKFELLLDDPMLALDVMEDWMDTLQFYRARAMAGWVGWLHSSAKHENTPKTLDAVAALLSELSCFEHADIEMALMAYDCHRGTEFLDEFDNLTDDAQNVLLRAYAPLQAVQRDGKRGAGDISYATACARASQ